VRALVRPLLPLLPFAALLVAAPAPAQPAAASSAAAGHGSVARSAAEHRAAAAFCPTGRISEIFIDNKSVFDVGSPELDPRFNRVYRTVNRLHVRTRPSVVRRTLLFREGDCFDAALVTDSEVALRGTPWIASADVFGVPQADGTYHVVVATRDEWTFRMDAQFESGDGFDLTGLELREDNLLGTGQRVAGYFREHQGERIHGAAYAHRQMFGTTAELDLGVARTPVGYSVTQRLAYPFRGETGRWAVRQQVEQLEHNFELFVPGPDGLEGGPLPEQPPPLDVVGVHRLGRRGSLTLLGAGLAGEWIEYPPDADLPAGGGEIADLAGLDTVSAVRVVLLAGQRNVRFERRRGPDAVRGMEDVRLGAEVEVGVGRSIGFLSRGDDMAVNTGVSVSAALPAGVLAGGRVIAEGRRAFGAEDGNAEWRNVFVQGDAWSYWRPHPDSRHTLVLAASGAGGWRTTVPFQLTLGSRSGMRGLPRHTWAGTERLVGTVEHRAYLGWPFPRLFDLGSAAFLDVGRSWAGDPRWGASAPAEVSVGGGLRVAFPAGSRDTYRLDVAYPLTGASEGRGVRVSFGRGQAVGRHAVSDDPQLRRSSRRPLAASLFTFPD
jgi:hypothetical protein